MTTNQKTSPKLDSNLKRAFDTAFKSVRENWGRGWEKLGQDVQMALLSEAVLVLADQQMVGVRDETVRMMVNQGRDYVLDLVYGTGA